MELEGMRSLALFDKRCMSEGDHDNCGIGRSTWPVTLSPSESFQLEGGTEGMSSDYSLSVAPPVFLGLWAKLEVCMAGKEAQMYVVSISTMLLCF